MKTNPSPTIEKILKEFTKTFGTFITIDGEYGSEADEAHKGKPFDIDEIKAFLTDKLQEVERETYGKVLEMLEEKPGEPGWSRQFNERLVKELSHLKNGEERIINKPFNKEEFIKQAREVRKTFEENPDDFEKFPKIEEKDWDA